MTQPYPRGSEWRKWDLHVHTPASICQHYGGNTEEAWEKFISDLEELPTEYKVIGINDYLFLEGYEKVLDYKENKGRLRNIDLLIPILEFRLNEFAGVEFGEYKRPNIHVIFADKSIVEPNIIKSQFLATLDAKYILEKDGTPYQRTLTPESLLELGERIISSVPESERGKYGTPEIEGFNNLNLKLDQIEESLKKDCFLDNYFLAIGKTEWDQLKWSDSSIASKKTLINSCKVIFTSSESVQSFQKAKNKLLEQGVNDLLLDCSDAHNFSDSKDKDGKLLKDRIGKCFTWIKADPTFEGFKQITYEPLERIRIQERDPEEEKKHWKLESVEIKNSTNSLLVDQKISFNSGLVSVIGGRGTGKTALLSILDLLNGQSDGFINWARTQGDADLIAKFFDRDGTEQEYNFKLSDYEDHSLPIYYLSQEIINNFSKEGDRPLIRKLFLEALGIDESMIYFSDESLRAESWIDNLEDIDIEEDNLISKYKQEANEKRITFENLGAYLIKSESLLKAQKATYSTEATKTILDKISKITVKGERIKKIKSSEKISSIRILAGNINQTIKEFMELFEEDDVDIKEILDTYDLSGFESKITKIDENIQKKLEILRQEYVNEVEKIKALGITDYKNLTTAIDQIDKDLEKIKQDNERFSQIQNERTQIYANLLSLSVEYKGKIEDIKLSIDTKFIEFQQDRDDLFLAVFDGISVSAGVYFHKKDFGELLKKCLYSNHNQVIEPFIALLTDNDSDKFFSVFNNDFFLKMRENREKFKRDNNGYYGMLRLVFKDCLQHINVHPKIELKGRELGGMSGGQQVTLLLKLKIASEGLQKDIIILDQPENHLDNKFITRDLVKLIKKLRTKRQIIIASHNANVVVGADSEQIIIARMDETDKKYLSGSLENKNIQSEVVLTLEGGEEAFRQRKKKYHIN